MFKQLLQEFHALPIPELKQVTQLTPLPGSYINLPCKLPNGQTAQLLDNGKT